MVIASFFHINCLFDINCALYDGLNHAKFDLQQIINMQTMLP